MYIPKTLAIVQRQGAPRYIQYVSFMERKQETVQDGAFLEEFSPRLFKPGFVSSPTLYVADYAQHPQWGATMQVIEEAQPNIPSKGWEILGSNGHDSHLIHPAWGIWTLSNNEILYLLANGPMHTLEFQFYVSHGALQIGLTEELEGVKAEAETNRCLSDITKEDIGLLIKIGTTKYVVSDDCGEGVVLLEVPSFSESNETKSSSYYNNGLQRRSQVFTDMGERYPMLAKVCKFQPNRWNREDLATLRPMFDTELRNILQFEFKELIQECGSLRKKFLIRWDRATTHGLLGYNADRPQYPQPLHKESHYAISPSLYMEKLKKNVYRAELVLYQNVDALVIEGTLEEVADKLVNEYQIYGISYTHSPTTFRVSSY